MNDKIVFLANCFGTYAKSQTADVYAGHLQNK